MKTPITLSIPFALFLSATSALAASGGGGTGDGPGNAVLHPQTATSPNTYVLSAEGNSGGWLGEFKLHNDFGYGDATLVVNGGEEAGNEVFDLGITGHLPIASADSWTPNVAVRDGMYIGTHRGSIIFIEAGPHLGGHSKTQYLDLMFDPFSGGMNLDTSMQDFQTGIAVSGQLELIPKVISAKLDGDAHVTYAGTNAVGDTNSNYASQVGAGLSYGGTLELDHSFGQAADVGLVARFDGVSDKHIPLESDGSRGPVVADNSAALYWGVKGDVNF